MSTYNLIFLIFKLLTTTETEEKLMAKAAIIGFNNPKAAKGIAIVL